MINTDLFRGDIIYILSLLFYQKDIQFLSDLARDINNNLPERDKELSQKYLSEIIELGVLSNRIEIKSNIIDGQVTDDAIVYNKKNLNELKLIISLKFEDFLDLKNEQIKYSYLINYTQDWINELNDKWNL